MDNPRSPIDHEQALREALGSGVQLSDREVSRVVKQISSLVPKGSMPGMIFSGLARLRGKKLSSDRPDENVNAVLRSLQSGVEQAAYVGLFATPASAIWLYQSFLKLMGMDDRRAFPDGTWQFYVSYALREDTARHTNETHGFDTALEHHQIYLKRPQRVTAWVMAAVTIIHQYDDLIRNEWAERVYLHLLDEIIQPSCKEAEKLYRQWAKRIPYGRAEDSHPDENYPQYRQRKFLAYVHEITSEMTESVYRDWLARVEALEKADLEKYQAQMSLLNYLEPDQYREVRKPIPLADTQIGIIFEGRYYLVPACEPGTTAPVSVETIFTHVNTILSDSDAPDPISIMPLARMKRDLWQGLRKRLSEPMTHTLDRLHTAPILLNVDPRPRSLPLAEIRMTERGAGNHALTLFDTGESVIFDQSHIFFDGAWGAALAEIMTNEALSWAVYLIDTEFPDDHQYVIPNRLDFVIADSLLGQLASSAHHTHEAWAESEDVSLKSMQLMRQLFKRRSDLIRLTVNDLLVLYRAIHASTYQPSADLAAKLKALQSSPNTRTIGNDVIRSIQASVSVNPSMLIPVDASLSAPRERVHPMSFEVPMQTLNLLDLHTRALQKLDEYERGQVADRHAVYEDFDQLQREYLVTLAGLGEILTQLKEIAVTGHTESMNSLKLLANMPQGFQRMLDKYSESFDWLNDMIKGREVFSNIGQVAKASTLSRFLTAKDDNSLKDLAWGVMSDNQGVMRITLRDFRPHVALLASIGQKALADEIAQDFLDSYARGLNKYITELHRITIASRETSLTNREAMALLRIISRIESRVEE